MVEAGGEALSADIYPQILVRSGAADCLNWRRVCQEWRRMITTRSFVLAHCRHRPPRPLLVVTLHDDDTPLLDDLDDLYDPKTRDLSDPNPMVARADGLDALVRFHQNDRAAGIDARTLFGVNLSEPGARADNIDTRAAGIDPRTLFGVNLSEPGARADDIDTRAFLIGNNPKTAVRANGADARALLLLWSLSSTDALAAVGVPRAGCRSSRSARNGAPLLGARVGARIPPQLGSNGSSFDAVLQSLYDESAPFVAMRVDAVDFRARISSALISFRGDPSSFKIHSCLDGMLLVSYSGSLFAYSPCSGRYTELPPVHKRALIIGFYAHPRNNDNRGAPEYCVLYCTTDKPHQYHYFSVGSAEDNCVCRPAALKEVERYLENGMVGCQLPPAFLHGSLHWLLGFNDEILVFDTATVQFRFMKPPAVENPASQIISLGGFLAVIEVYADDPVIKVWKLIDYELGVWAELYKIDLPLDIISPFIGDPDQDGNPSTYIVSQDGEIVLECPHELLHFDKNGMLLGRYHYRDGRFTLDIFTSYLFA